MQRRLRLHLRSLLRRQALLMEAPLCLRRRLRRHCAACTAAAAKSPASCTLHLLHLLHHLHLLHLQMMCPATGAAYLAQRTPPLCGVVGYSACTSVRSQSAVVRATWSCCSASETVRSPSAQGNFCGP